ncbi:hypothetical protein N7454_005767 [Penicillium verhagenii]|nr:hypothetical protein N7454_005767 [Penicillium verhagenii]
MMNCRPIVESAEPDIIVNPSNGEIQTFSTTSQPTELTEAILDNFLQVVRDVESGWFVDEAGGLRWEIEMEESFAEGPGVY